MSETKQPKQPRCMYLTCKSMMVYGEDFVNDDEFQEGLIDLECTRTFTNIGPDNGEASLELCSDPNRQCYREY